MGLRVYSCERCTKFLCHGGSCNHKYEESLLGKIQFKYTTRGAVCLLPAYILYTSFQYFLIYRLQVFSMDDILSLIFIYASDGDWRAPVHVGLTCKRWRALILDTPTAWRLDQLHRIPADHVSTWIARSGDHRTISLTVPSTATSQWVNVIISHRKRINRLRLHAHHDLLTRELFPMVNTLELFEGNGAYGPIKSWLKVYSMNITPVSYPSLQSLSIYSDNMCTFTMQPIPIPIPVTNLFLESRNLTSWGELLIACASTVVVLTLKVLPGLPSVIRLPTIGFPRLVALIISGDQLPLDLTTPQMSFLHLQACHQRVLSSIDVSGVTSLVLDTQIPDPSHPFTATTRVLIHPGTSSVIAFLRSVSRNPANYPSLSQVAISTAFSIPDQTRDACLSRCITIQPTGDTHYLEDNWRCSHMPNQLCKTLRPTL